jgi:DNA modification methylase
MNTDQIYVGHAAQVLADFPDGCIDMIATSPLYWQSDDGSSRWLSLLICNRRGTSVPVYSDQTARLRIFDFNGAASQMRNCVTAITATPRAVS